MNKKAISRVLVSIIVAVLVLLITTPLYGKIKDMVKKAPEPTKTTCALRHGECKSACSAGEVHDTFAVFCGDPTLKCCVPVEKLPGGAYPNPEDEDPPGTTPLPRSIPSYDEMSGKQATVDLGQTQCTGLGRCAEECNPQYETVIGDTVASGSTTFCGNNKQQCCRPKQDCAAAGGSCVDGIECKGSFVGKQLVGACVGVSVCCEKYPTTGSSGSW
jgi:hypothetical protein